MIKRFLSHGLLLSFLLATSAFAGEFSGSLNLMSSYMSRGTDQDVHHGPQVLGTIGYTASNGFYGTALGATMDFGEGTKREGDLFGGYRHPIGNWLVDVGFASINYPRSPNPWNFIEYDIKADHSFGKGNIGLWYGYTKSYFHIFGRGQWFEVHSTYPITDKVSVSGAAAHQELGNGYAYNTFNVGTIISLAPTVLLDIRFSDTNKQILDPIYHTYDGRVAVTLTKLF